jgi:aquaglyceroporin related protein
MLAQVLGAMAAAAVVYGNYKSAFDAFEGGAGIRTVSGPTATAGIFCTYPQPCMSSLTKIMNTLLIYEISYV